MKVEDAIQEGKPSHEIANFDIQLSEALSNYKKISKYYDHYPNGIKFIIKISYKIKIIKVYLDV